MEHVGANESVDASNLRDVSILPNALCDNTHGSVQLALTPSPSGSTDRRSTEASGMTSHLKVLYRLPRRPPTSTPPTAANAPVYNLRSVSCGDSDSTVTAFE